MRQEFVVTVTGADENILATFSQAGFKAVWPVETRTGETIPHEMDVWVHADDRNSARAQVEGHLPSGGTYTIHEVLTRVQRLDELERG